MKLISTLLLSLVTAAATAAAVLPPAATIPRGGSPLRQRPLAGPLPIDIMPPSDDASPSAGTTTQRAVSLSDIITTQRSLTTFSSVIRMQESLSDLLGDLSTNTTILAPLNSAIDALPRKPWEDPRDYAALGAQSYDGPGGEGRANNNLRRFIEAHLVTSSSWAAGDKVKTVGGRTVWWEERSGKRFIMPDDVEVDKVASKVANGELWILKGALNAA